MKTTVLVVLLFSSCFASSLYQEWSAKANSKRADQATITCQTVNNQCVNLGGSCSAGCPDCVAAFTSCEASASSNEALCTCANTFINCYAAAKDPSCNSDFYHDQCLAQISNCTCGTPYTGALTAKSCYSNAYCTDAGTCVSVKGVGSACNYSSECGDVNADPSWSYDYTCENNVCQKSVKNLPGDSCSSNSDCEFYADFSLGCSSGKCASQQVGSVCPMSGNNVYCGPNLYCDDQDTCRKTIAFGSTCDGNATESARTSMCGNLGACDSDSNTCVRYLSKTKGQSCTFEGECADGLYCSKNTSTCQSNLPQIACNSDDDCTKANPDYTGCDCFGGKPMCSAPTSACNSEGLALYTCIEDNNCPTDFIPGGCVQNNCKKEHDCYFACYSNYIAQAYGGSGDSCLSNYVNTCDAPSFAAKNSVAWAVVASASAAAILL